MPLRSTPRTWTSTRSTTCTTVSHVAVAIRHAATCAPRCHSLQSFALQPSIQHTHTLSTPDYLTSVVAPGAPKQWYCIPPGHRRRFEGLMRDMLPEMFRACPEFFRHKARAGC